MNFVEFITPIARISSSCSMLLNDIITNIVPTVGVLVVIALYFFYTDIPLGTGFLIGNVLIWVYLAYFWKDMFLYKQKQEQKELVKNLDDYYIKILLSRLSNHHFNLGNVPEKLVELKKKELIIKRELKNQGIWVR